jgi:ATP-dependent RNA helicase DDX1
VNPTWVDLKGFESVPETVHHVVYRVDPVRDAIFKEGALHSSVTDEVHQPSDLTDRKHASSQAVKEIKPHVLLKLIDKFQVR